MSEIPQLKRIVNVIKFEGNLPRKYLKTSKRKHYEHYSSKNLSLILNPVIRDSACCIHNQRTESETNLGTFLKLSPYIGVSYKFVLKSVKSLNWICWGMEYWFKALGRQIWSTNTKLFFRESETNLGTLQRHSPYIGVSYKFVLKCVKNLSWLWFSCFQTLLMLNVQLSNIQLEIM